MKRIFIIKPFIIALCLIGLINTGNAQNDADPAITSMSFAKSPIEVNEETTLTVFVTNAGFTTAVAAGSIGLSISLPTGAEYAAFPESVAALSGTFLSKFNWTYDLPNKNFLGTSNEDILPGDGGTIVINIKGYIAVNSRISVANILRFNPGAYPNDNTTNNNLSIALGVEPLVLPVKLLSFNATKVEKAVHLNWETETETSSNYFDVQTSSTGTAWQSIGIVNAVGNSTTNHSYSILHQFPVTGINYYRLKQVDNNARIEYSDIRTINFKTNNTITILPNPTTDKVLVTAGNTGTLKTVALYSSEGKLIQRINNFILGKSIDMSNYAPGVYLLKFINKNEITEVIKIIKI
jgi:Secretion system C-terminal sorting domain